MISVIMLTYNREKFISGMIEDVLNQTYTDYEFIIVDNGSSDCSGQIADDYAKKDNRIKCIHLEREESIGKGRNIGLQVSRGEFVTYVDDDDHIEKDFLEFLFDLVSTYHADISMCGATELLGGVLSPQCMYDEKLVLSSAEAIEKLLERKYIRAGMPTKLIRRELLLEFPFIESVRHEDIHTIYKYLSGANRIVLYGLPKYCFIRHGENVSFFTSDASKITSSQLKEYMNAFHSRTEFLTEKYPDLNMLLLYSEWSYMISMCKKIKQYNLSECYEEYDYMKNILKENYTDLMTCPHLMESERTFLIELIRT